MLSAGWYDGKGAKETVVVVGCVKRVWVVVACGFLPTNADVACRLIRWNSADMGRLGAGDDDSEFRSSVDMDGCEVEKGMGRQGCGIVTLSTFLKDDNIWEGSGSKRSVSSAAETSDVNSAMENGGGDGERCVVVVVAVDILLTNSGRVKNDDDFFSLPI